MCQNSQANTEKPTRATYCISKRCKESAKVVGQISMPRRTVPTLGIYVITGEKLAIMPQYVSQNSWKVLDQVCRSCIN